MLRLVWHEFCRLLTQHVIHECSELVSQPLSLSPHGFLFVHRLQHGALLTDLLVCERSLPRHPILCLVHKFIMRLVIALPIFFIVISIVDGAPRN